jgi:hypothetical protein
MREADVIIARYAITAGTILGLVWIGSITISEAIAFLGGVVLPSTHLLDMGCGKSEINTSTGGRTAS